ncbi:MAG: hypothetical protein H0T14_07645 [Nocardioidaceae bacterium]|nr:hypothetical protein [Nocardioidaceae bacterium]
MSDYDDFQRQLRGIATDAASQARLQPAADIRRRAARRRGLQVTGSALATAGLVVGIWAVAAPGTDNDGILPAGPPTSTTSGPAPTESGAPTRPTEPASTTEVPPDDGPPKDTAEPQPPPPGGWVTTLPDPVTLVLVHDGQKAGHSEESDWKPVEGTDTWLLVPCDGFEDAGYPSDKLRTEHRAIAQSGIERVVAEQVAVYPSDVEAIQAMQEMRQALIDCSDERTRHPADGTYTDSFWDFADSVAKTSVGNLEPDESFQAWNWNRTYNEEGQPTYGLGGGFFTVTRVGNAVLLTVSDGETDWGRPGAPAEVAVELAKTTRAVLINLCEWYSAADGC